MGLPVIASDQGGIPELIQHNHDGLLVPLGNVNAFTEEMLRLVVNRSLRKQLGDAAREKIKQHYLPSKYIDDLFQIYRHTFAKKGLTLPYWLEAE